jgi:hypothetical protein
MSEELKFEYLSNIRKIGNAWKFNKFRDMSKLFNSNDSYYTNSGNPSTLTTTYTNMFTVDGMHEIQNLEYLNLEKLWNLQKKFVDKWLGIRLICSNSTNYSVNLYTSSVEKRKFYR